MIARDAAPDGAARRDADYVFFELTRSICPVCRRVVDAHIVLRDDKVYLRKHCPEHGPCEVLVYGDARAYVAHARVNRPGRIPRRFTTAVEQGCPHDCGLCPEHQQHVCVGIIEVTSVCNMACPLCFADAGVGFSLALDDVERILDHLVETEGHPEMVQFSGGEPSIHPEIVPMLRAAKARGIPHVVLNTNGRRIAHDDAFLAELAELRPSIYFQFDGFDAETSRAIRGEADLLPEKLRALDRLAAIGCDVVLVPAIERGVNEHEVGRIVRFGLAHPAVRGINFQPAFHAGRFGQHDPLRRMTNPDVIRLIEAQTDGLFHADDFVPIPCCFPSCNSVTYAYVEGSTVLPLPRVLEVDTYLDYLANRALPEPLTAVKAALEGLWSSAAAPGSEQVLRHFARTCAACGLVDGGVAEDSATQAGQALRALTERVFMVMLQDFMDPWTFNQKNVMKCCKEILLPDGKQIPFCAYNSVGYREQARVQLAARQRARVRSRRAGMPFDPPPLHFSFGPPGSNREAR